MSNETRGLNLMNAEHIALLAYMQRYIQSIAEQRKKPCEVITVRKPIDTDRNNKV